MVSLPVEVLHLIFPLLIQRDKLECMTVCRQWHDIIFHHSLFPVILIDSNPQLSQLIKTVKRNPLLGKKVDHLILIIDLPKNYDRTIFINLFPNLRDFTIVNWDYSGTGQQHFKPVQNHPWCERIQHLVENNSDLHARTLLDSGPCHNLTYLSISGRYSESVRSLFLSLASAPALKELHLTEYSLFLSDLELIHQHAPTLTVLSFEQVDFLYVSLPPDIKPATTVTNLRGIFSRCARSVDYIPCARYLSQKYTHLEELTIELYHLDLENVETAEHRSVVKTHLKTLGPRLKNLSIYFTLENGSIYGFTFDELDQYGCQIQQLQLRHRSTAALLQQLANSNQVQYIQSLTVDQMVLEDEESKNPLVSLDWLRPFTMLKKLVLHFPRFILPEHRYKVCLTRLLDILSGVNLEMLSLQSVQLDYDKDSSKWSVYPSLKELVLNLADCKMTVDSFLCTSFPNLKRLKMKYCDLQLNSLEFMDWDLSCLEISSTFEEDSKHVMVYTTKDHQKRLYPIGRKGVYDRPYLNNEVVELLKYPYIHSKPCDDWGDFKEAVIICSSVQTVIVVSV